jgi:hypothetical protein
VLHFYYSYYIVYYFKLTDLQSYTSPNNPPISVEEQTSKKNSFRHPTDTLLFGRITCNRNKRRNTRTVITSKRFLNILRNLQKCIGNELFFLHRYKNSKYYYSARVVSRSLRDYLTGFTIVYNYEIKIVFIVIA